MIFSLQLFWQGLKTNLETDQKESYSYWNVVKDLMKYNGIEKKEKTEEYWNRLGWKEMKENQRGSRREKGGKGKRVNDNVRNINTCKFLFSWY